jgi:hypothetical protein
VIESGPEGGWTGVGTSAAATNLEGQPNATSLPIGQGDTIGVDFPAGSSLSVIGWEKVTNAESFEWFSPLLQDGGEFREPFIDREQRLLFGAEEVLAPVVSSLSPATGNPVGGNAVTISGKYLDGATSVTFGSTPASSFSVDSLNQITAIAPASTASTVDVRVTGPGGASQVGAGDRYTSTAPAPTTSTTLAGSSPLGSVIATPAASGFRESASRWRRGRALPHISGAGKPPLGTTFSFTLNEPATVSLSFTQRVPGRSVNGRCVAVGQRNTGKPKCKRTVSVGSLGLAGHAGLDQVRFQGRLSSAKTLKPGSYTVTIIACDSHGLASAPYSLSFTIIPG